MEVKTQHHKLNRSVEENVEDPCKGKKKTKERKELWDSLLEVYEKEADKENTEEVSVADIEKWIINHPRDSPRALPLVNPNIVFNALSGTVPDIKTARSKSRINQNQIARGRKRRRETSLKESSLVSTSSRSKKKNVSLKKTLKPKRSVNNSVNTSLNKKQKLKSDDQLKSKFASVNSSAIIGKKTKSKSIKSSGIKVTKKISQPSEKVKVLKCKTPQHTCNLTLSYYSNEEIPSTRADGRVFRCKLVFRVCECFESDEKASKLFDRESELQNALQLQRGLQRKDSNKIKSKKKTKVRQSKNTLANHSSVSAVKPFPDQTIEKLPHKYKSSSKYFEVLSRFPKEENNNAPVVILHHRGEKPFEKSKERISVDNKHRISPAQTRIIKDHKVRARNESISNSLPKCNEQFDDTSHLKNIKPSRDEINNRLVKCALNENPNIGTERKIKTKKTKLSKQVFPVDSLSNPNDYIANQMKSLPVRIEDNPLTFMNLFRTANVFNGYKDHKKFDDVMKLYCENLKQEEKKHLKGNTKRNSKEYVHRMNSSESLMKLYINKRSSSKLLKGASSRKRLKKIKNRSVLMNGVNDYCVRDKLENIPESLGNTHINSRKDLRKKRTKYLSSKSSTINNTLNKRLETLLSKEKVNLNTIKKHKKSLHDNYHIGTSLTYRPECGDGIVSDFASQPSSQNNKLSTIYSESITNETAQKDSTETDQFNMDIKNHGDFQTISESSTILRNNDSNKKCVDKSSISSKDVGKISIVKPTVSEDGKKLTFQLVKAGCVQKNNITKLNKHFYRLDNKRFLKTSKESLSVKKDKLMLFYAKRESSCTSKDSLNIAISRDTEVSNNGSSNNVLNVVIKQTKSSSSNSKTPPSRDFDLEREDFQEMNDFKFQRENTYEGCMRNAYGNESEEFCCQTYKILAGNQTENSSTAPNNQEVDSKPTTRHKIDDNQQKYLKRNTFGFCCLQHSPMASKQMSAKKGLVNKLLNLKSSPEAKDITQLPHYVHFPESQITLDSENVCISHQGNDSNFKQQDKCQNNSPKINKFNNAFQFNEKVDSLKSSAQVGYKKTSTAITQLVDSKRTQNVAIQCEEPKKISKLGNNNKQSPKYLDDLGLKLQVIGLSQKNSFIKVIESESVENLSHKSKINNLEETRESKKEERNVQTSVKSHIEENKKEYYIPTKQNISNEEELRAKYNNFKKDKSLKKVYQIEPKECLNTESIKDDLPIVMKQHLLKEEHCLDDFGKTEFSNQNKDRFVTILPMETNHIAKTNINLETSSTNFLNEQVAESKEKVMVCSEVGVQTDFPISQSRKTSEIPIEKVTDILPVPNENIIKATDILPLTNENNRNPIKIKNCIDQNLLSKDSCRFVNKQMLLTPAKRGSFVHIVNNNTKKRTDSSGNNKRPICSLLNKTTQMNLANKDQILNQLINNKQQKDDHLINKINAIYDFLQYLDKILKNKALIKQSEDCEASIHNIDSLNKTLRCLCSSCIEILHKIEVNQLKKQQNGKCFKDAERSFFDKYTNKRSLFVSKVSPQRELEWRKDDDSNVEYVNISEVEKPIERDLQRAFPEPKTHKWNPKPFFVVVPSNEIVHNSSTHNSSEDVPKKTLQNAELYKESKNVFNSNSHYFQMEDEIDNMLLGKKIKNSKLPKNKVNNSNIICNGKQLSETSLKYYTIDKPNMNDRFFSDLQKEIRNSDSSLKALYKKNIGSRRLQKCSSCETLLHFSQKCNSCDKNTSLQVYKSKYNISNKSVQKAKPVNSDPSLELKFRKAIDVKAFAKNNQLINYHSHVSGNTNCGDSVVYLQRSDSKLSNNTYEEDLETSKLDVSNSFENSCSHFGDGLEKKANQCIFKSCVVKRNEIANKVFSKKQQNPTDIGLPYFLSSNKNQLKSESCQCYVNKMCTTTTMKNDTKILTGSVSKNKQYVKQSELNNKKKPFQEIQNIAKKTIAFLKPNLHTHEKKSYGENNGYCNTCDSKASIVGSFTCKDSLSKNSFYHKTILGKNLELKHFQNGSIIFQNSDETGQLLHKSVLKANQEKDKNVLENKELNEDYQEMSTANVLTPSQQDIPKCVGNTSRKSSKLTLRNLDSTSSIDSLFSQNKETLVFTNRHLPLNEGSNISYSSCNSQQESQEFSKIKEIPNGRTICDSPGWISISSCELLDNNKNAIIDNSVLSNDPEKVRLQMDIKLNDVMHVEFFCQPSDPVKLSKEKNKLPFQM